MKWVLVALSMTAGSWAALETVALMNQAASAFQSALAGEQPPELRLSLIPD